MNSPSGMSPVTALSFLVDPVPLPPRGTPGPWYHPPAGMELDGTR